MLISSDNDLCTLEIAIAVAWTRFQIRIRLLVGEDDNGLLLEESGSRNVYETIRETTMIIDKELEKGLERE
jgi:hypothetical protein